MNSLSEFCLSRVVSPHPIHNLPAPPLPSSSFPFPPLTAVDADQKDLQLQALSEGMGGGCARENGTLDYNMTTIASWWDI